MDNEVLCFMEEKLLRLLEQDCSYTNEQLATMLGITAEEVKAKIAALVEKGVILKYTALVNWEKTERVCFAHIELGYPTAWEGFDRVAGEFTNIEVKVFI